MAKKFYNRFIKDNTLILGDGDFSFTKKLVQVQEQLHTVHITTTSVYPAPDQVHSTFKYLDKKNILRVALDATLLHEFTDIIKFHTLVWNFPYPNQSDDYTNLLHQFFHSAQKAAISRVILGLKATQEEPDHQHDRWGVHEIAQSYSYDLQSKSDVVSPFWNVTHINGQRLRSTKSVRHYEYCHNRYI